MTQATAKAPEGILERIRKCLALGDKTKGATEAEAETAIRMAKTLMAKHNLSMSDVAFEESKKEGIKTAHDTSSRKTKEAWEIHLVYPINKLFGTNVYLAASTAVFYGMGEDAALAAESYTTLLKVIRRMSTESGKVHGSEWHGDKREYNGRERNNYCLGIVDTLHRRACEQAEGLTKAEENRERGMVVVKNALVEKHRESLDLKPGRSRNYGHDDAARSRGRKDGTTVNMTFRNQIGEGR